MKGRVSSLGASYARGQAKFQTQDVLLTRESITCAEKKWKLSHFMVSEGTRKKGLKCVHALSIFTTKLYPSTPFCKVQCTPMESEYVLSVHGEQIDAISLARPFWALSILHRAARIPCLRQHSKSITRELDGRDGSYPCYLALERLEPGFQCRSQTERLFPLPCPACTPGFLVHTPVAN